MDTSALFVVLVSGLKSLYLWPPTTLMETTITIELITLDWFVLIVILLYPHGKDATKEAAERIEWRSKHQVGGSIPLHSSNPRRGELAQVGLTRLYRKARVPSSVKSRQPAAPYQSAQFFGKSRRVRRESTPPSVRAGTYDTLVCYQCVLRWNQCLTNGKKADCAE